jgi:hypothetical protein
MYCKCKYLPNNVQIFELYHNLPAKRPAIAEVKDLMRVEELSEA